MTESFISIENQKLFERVKKAREKESPISQYAQANSLFEMFGIAKDLSNNKDILILDNDHVLSFLLSIIKTIPEFEDIKTKTIDETNIQIYKNIRTINPAVYGTLNMYRNYILEQQKKGSTEKNTEKYLRVASFSDYLLFLLSKYESKEILENEFKESFEFFRDLFSEELKVVLSNYLERRISKEILISKIATEFPVIGLEEIIEYIKNSLIVNVYLGEYITIILPNMLIRKIKHKQIEDYINSKTNQKKQIKHFIYKSEINKFIPHEKLKISNIEELLGDANIDKLRTKIEDIIVEKVLAGMHVNKIPFKDPVEHDMFNLAIKRIIYSTDLSISVNNYTEQEKPLEEIIKDVLYELSFSKDIAIIYYKKTDSLYINAKLLYSENYPLIPLISFLEREQMIEPSAYYIIINENDVISKKVEPTEDIVVQSKRARSEQNLAKRIYIFYKLDLKKLEEFSKYVNVKSIKEILERIPSYEEKLSIKEESEEITEDLKEKLDKLKEKLKGQEDNNQSEQQ